MAAHASFDSSRELVEFLLRWQGLATQQANDLVQVG